MRTIRLYGFLGKMFGRVHQFDVKSPAEALKALMANFPDFRKYLEKNPQSEYRCLIADEPQVFGQLGNPFGSRESFKIVPVVQGAGKGVASIIIGALLIAATIFMPALAAVTIPLLSTTVGAVAVSIGVSLILGGLMQAIIGTPEGAKQNSPAAENPSYAFSGAVNTTAQGNCVPLCYGELIVGSAVISTGLEIR